MSIAESFKAFRTPFAASFILLLLGALVPLLAWLAGVVGFFLWGRAARQAVSRLNWTPGQAVKRAALPVLIIAFVSALGAFSVYLLGFGVQMVDAMDAANATIQAAVPVPAGTTLSLLYGVSAAITALIGITFWSLLAVFVGAWMQTRKG